MTEAEWLACTNPQAMLAFLRDQANDRKLRLFACACCRRIWPLLTDVRSRRAVEVAERFADSQATDQERAAACAAANEVDWQITREEGEGDSAREMANCAAVKAVDDAAAFGPCDPEELSAAADSSQCAAATQAYQFTRATHRNTAQRRRVQQVARGEELAVQAVLLRCIFGNPFRPMAVDPAWQLATADVLAATIYQERAFAQLPILADALEEAGCTNEDMLAHCRQPGSHVRGCWVIDALLGK